MTSARGSGVWQSGDGAMARLDGIFIRQHVASGPHQPIDRVPFIALTKPAFIVCKLLSSRSRCRVHLPRISRGTLA